MFKKRKLKQHLLAFGDEVNSKIARLAVLEFYSYRGLGCLGLLKNAKNAYLPKRRGDAYV